MKVKQRKRRDKLGISYLVFIAVYIALIAMFILTLWAIPRWIYAYELRYGNNVERALQEVFENNTKVTISTELQKIRAEYPLEIVVYRNDEVVYNSVRVENFRSLRGLLSPDVLIKEVQGNISGKDGVYLVWYSIYTPLSKGYVNTLIVLQTIYIFLSFLLLVFVTWLLQRRMQKPLEEIKENIFKLESYELAEVSNSDDVINETAYRFANQLYGKIRAISRNHTELEYALQSERERLTNLMTVSRGLVHNLKTPLHRSMLENERFVRQQEEILPQTEILSQYNMEQYNIMIKQINEILYLMDSDIKQMAEIKDSFDLVEMIKGIRKNFNIYLNERGLWLNVEEPLSLPVHLNRVATHLIIHNMLSNAMQYATKDTEINFGVEIKNNQIVINCQNQTIEKNIERILNSSELFYEIDENDAMHTYSTGNGMYLIKELSNLVGGTYNVELTGDIVSVIVYLPLLNEGASHA